MRQKYPDLIVNAEDTIISVLKKMDASRRKLLIVTVGNQFKSLISIGDIQRAIIKNVNLTAPISRILRQEITVASTEDDLSLVKSRIKIRRNEFMPIVSPLGKLVNIIFWEDLFEEKLQAKAAAKFNLPVIIMAGGKGTRLKPLTNILPKPLIPINEKSIIEDIFERFSNHGCKEFYISVNYKAAFIEYYLKSQNLPYNFSFFKEKKTIRHSRQPIAFERKNSSNLLC